MSKKEYRRLTRGRTRPGFAVAFGGRCSLWLGADHLLSIESTGYSEKYKRFYFRDIQGIIIRETDSWKGWTIALAAVAFLSVLLAVMIQAEVSRWIFGSLGALFLLILLLHVLAGPSCACHIRTAVHFELLPSLNRVRRARRILAVLKPAIAAAQGELPPEEIPLRSQEFVSGRSAPRSATAPVSEPAPPVAEPPLDAGLPPVIQGPGA